MSLPSFGFDPVFKLEEPQYQWKRYRGERVAGDEYIVSEWTHENRDYVAVVSFDPLVVRVHEWNAIRSRWVELSIPPGLEPVIDAWCRSVLLI